MIVYEKSRTVLAPTTALITFDKQKHFYSPIAVGLLNRLCFETKAQIVISSSWRLHGAEPIATQLINSLDMLNTMLDSEQDSIPIHLKFFAEEPHKEQSWRTPANFESMLQTKSRGAQIDAWLRTWGHHIDNYCILDDNDNMLPQQQANFVFINRNLSGFDAYYYIQAFKILYSSDLKQKYCMEYLDNSTAR